MIGRSERFFSGAWRLDPLDSTAAIFSRGIQNKKSRFSGAQPGKFGLKSRKKDAGIADYGIWGSLLLRGFGGKEYGIQSILQAGHDPGREACL